MCSYLIPGSTIGSIIGWLAVVGHRIKNGCNRNRVMSQHNSNRKDTLTILPITLDKYTDRMIDLRDSCFELTNQNFGQQNRAGSRTQAAISEGAINFQTMSKNDREIVHNISNYMVMEKMNGICQQLEDLKATNTTLLDEMKKTNDKNDSRFDEADKTYKLLKASIALHHREARRRLRKVETKLNTEYFQ